MNTETPLNRRPLWPYVILIFLSRIPFIFSGYGSEEDAWGLIRIAEIIGTTGVYEVSRLPGHPFQEYFLSLIWHFPSWILNLLTVIISTTGVYYFMRWLRLKKIESYAGAGIMLAFVPVFYINSTNIMDYTWALSLVMISMYLTENRKLILAGILLGIACGFRITAGGMLLPFFIMLYGDKNFIKNAAKLSAFTILTALACFLPVFLTYGKEFFTYYEYFPYPPMLKNLYKASLGAWGLIGSVALMIMVFLTAQKYFSLSRDVRKGYNKNLLVSLTAIALYSYAYLKIPQKSAFVIPMIPFIIIPVALLLNKKQMNTFALIMMASCFLFGVNLDDPFRGSGKSLLGISFSAGHTLVILDPLNGPVTADLQKRQIKMAYAETIAKKLHDETAPTLIVAGWWQNELFYFSKTYPNKNVEYVYYVDESVLKSAKEAGKKIYFLPEQEFYNDLRFRSEFTEKYAVPLKMD